jgi:hypothetical protein
MTINGIKSKKIGAGPETAYVAEAEVENCGETVYVTVQMYDGEECTVSKESVYAFLAEDDGEPASEFLEEYEELDVAIEESDYGEVFEKLGDAIDELE